MFKINRKQNLPSVYERSIFHFTILSLLLASSLKPVGEFTDGVFRTYSTYVGILSESSNVFTLLSMFGATFYLVNGHLRYGKIPSLNTPLVLYILLKLWGLFVYLIYGEFNTTLFLSLLLTFMVSQFVFSYEEKNKDAFKELTLSLTFFSIIFVSLNIYEFTVNKAGVLWVGRLFGTTNHPNFLGGYCAILSHFVLFHALKEQKTKIKLVYFLTLLSLFLMILSSGSRSSLASVLLGLFVFSFFRIGFWKSLTAIFLIGSVVVLLSSIVMTFSENLGFRLDRLSSTQNTREYVNWELWKVFLENLLIGDPISTGSTANSYLLVLARMGIVGGFILILIITLTLKSIIKSIIWKRNYGYKIAYLSSLATITLYSIFEGVLVENFSLGQIIFILTLAYINSNSYKLR